MATSRFSLTLFCPMNSCNRCGRSLSSKEESSSTGAAETSRSFKFGKLRLSLAADTEGDVSSSRRPLASVERTLLSAAVEVDFEPAPAVDFELILKNQDQLRRTRMSALHKSQPNHAQPHALKLADVKPAHLLPKPGFIAG